MKMIQVSRNLFVTARPSVYGDAIELQSYGEIVVIDRVDIPRLIEVLAAHIQKSEDKSLRPKC